MSDCSGSVSSVFRAVTRSRRAPVYDGEFFNGINADSARSAEVVLPLVFDALGRRPESVVDVGCGTGAWLRAFADAGVDDYLGIDGAYVNAEQLLIPNAKLLRTDLNEPIRLDRRFDLVVCLEVAEHLAEGKADRFVSDLVMLGDLVLFSAAIPFQGGIGHVNEQWPEYWRLRFANEGYRALDPFRLPLWDNPNVQSWFKQNLLLYASEKTLTENPRLAALSEQADGRLLALVHPETYASKARVATRLMDVIPRPVLNAARRRWHVNI